jgi:hypothetical protein
MELKYVLTLNGIKKTDAVLKKNYFRYYIFLIIIKLYFVNKNFIVSYRHLY